MFSEEEARRIPDRIRRARVPPMLGVIIIIGMVLLLLSSMMYVFVDVGYALLLSDPITRTVTDVAAVGPSWYFKMPWQSAVLIYYATDTYEDLVPCFSKDQLEMRLQVLVRWSLDPTKIRDLYLSYPTLDYKAKAVESIMEETMRLVTKDYSVIDTIGFRDVVTQQIQKSVLDALKAEPSLGDVLTHLEFDLKNIEYPIKYTSAIEDKLVAEQQKIQAEFEKQKIIILANATAQQSIIEAEGQAQAKIVVADGIKQAIQMISESAGITNSTRIAELYMYLETLKQIAPDVNVLIMTTGEGGIPIIYQIPSDSTG
ncbi:MAG: SPFH domain-containing protein [Candidatus Bathyarchaeota archaeon]|nr:SPFH domain-containing protein [Candidatus Bathyarchaeota archaeon]